MVYKFTANLGYFVLSEKHETCTEWSHDTCKWEKSGKIYSSERQNSKSLGKANLMHLSYTITQSTVIQNIYFFPLQTWKSQLPRLRIKHLFHKTKILTSKFFYEPIKFNHSALLSNSCFLHYTNCCSQFLSINHYSDWILKVVGGLLLIQGCRWLFY